MRSRNDTAEFPCVHTGHLRGRRGPRTFARTEERPKHGPSAVPHLNRREVAVTDTSAPPAAFITPEALLAHWQGHRNLTRRLIEAFPEDQLFTYSVGGMRTFGDMALEILGMAEPMVR